MNTTMNIKSGEKVEGWVLLSNSNKVVWMRGISKAGAFHQAKRHNAVWCRQFVVRNDEKFVVC
jgi:hypothetical protein